MCNFSVIDGATGVLRKPSLTSVETCWALSAGSAVGKTLCIRLCDRPRSAAQLVLLICPERPEIADLFEKSSHVRPGGFTVVAGVWKPVEQVDTVGALPPIVQCRSGSHRLWEFQRRSVRTGQQKL